MHLSLINVSGFLVSDKEWEQVDPRRDCCMVTTMEVILYLIIITNFTVHVNGPWYLSSKAWDLG